MSDVVIKVEDLCKKYRLGLINHGMLSKDLQSWWAKVRGKDDPNAVIRRDDNERIRKDELFPDPAQDEIFALKDMNFEVKQGEVLGIIGANGAGKSTLLKILSRVTAPTTGSIKIKGRIGSLLEVGTGFHPELTGLENIYLNGAILGMRRWEIDKKLDEIIDFSGVEKFIDTPVKRYSSGMYVRLAFAVAAHLDPEILIVDEVLAVGDAEFQKKCLGKMGDISEKEGRTVLFVSHNMGAVRKLCNRVIMLENGMKTSEGTSEDMVYNYLNKKYSNVDQRISFSDHLIAPEELEIFEVKYKSTDELPASTFEIFNEYYIDLRVKLHKYAHDYRVGLAILDLYGNAVMSLVDWKLSFTEVSDTAGKHLVIRIKYFNTLSPGKYRVLINVKKGGVLVDEINAPEIVVIEKFLGERTKAHKGLIQGQYSYEIFEDKVT